MTVLGIETSTIVCAVAVVNEDTVLGEASRVQRNAHAESLIDLLDEALRHAGVSADDLDGIAVSIGPGSFTGLRIGLSVGKGLAYALGKPLVAVPTLHALAEKAVDAGLVSDEGWVLPALDARREEVYCQLFQLREGKLWAAWDVCSVKIADIRPRLNGRIAVVLGDGAEKVFAHERKASGEQPADLIAVAGSHSSCGAASVARVGLEKLKRGELDDPASLEPHYIKEFFSLSRVHS
jgi:tRNA threonylcarbamoyladenosine biosynthesis protein TsaB